MLVSLNSPAISAPTFLTQELNTQQQPSFSFSRKHSLRFFLFFSLLRFCAFEKYIFRRDRRGLTLNVISRESEEKASENENLRALLV